MLGFLTHNESAGKEISIRKKTHYERKVKKQAYTHTLFLFLSGWKSEITVEPHLIKYSPNVGTQRKIKRGKNIEAQQQFWEVF